MKLQSIIRRPKILVIDDDPLFRSLMVSILRDKYLVFVANDGEEGFRKALTHPPDAAIIDICMPGWDGLKTLRVMRQCEPLADLPLMMLTSDASRETVITAIHSGASDYLIKSSFSKDEFLRKLQRLLENSMRGPMSLISRNRLEAILDRSKRENEDDPLIAPDSTDTEIETASAAVDTPADSLPPESDAQLQEIMDAWD